METSLYPIDGEGETPRVSLVIPCYNEEESVDELLTEAFKILDDNGITGEIVIVDDGSTDRTWDKLSSWAEREERLKLLRFRRNFGQTAAMVAAIDHAIGEIIIPLDADLQNDPKSIPDLLAKIDEGYDVVSGWRKSRQDIFISRRLPSMIANYIISWVSGVKLHDYGCTLKAYRRDMLEQIRVYGELHRFIPALMAEVGAEVREMEVNHRPRLLGQSKYKLDRTIRVALDLLLVVFLRRYVQRPLHVFGGLGVLLGLVGASLLGYLAIEKFVFGEAIGDRPMLAFALTLAISAIVLVVQGLLGELMIRLLHETGQRPQYRLKMSRKLTAAGRIAAPER